LQGLGARRPSEAPNEQFLRHFSSSFLARRSETGPGTGGARSNDGETPRLFPERTLARIPDPVHYNHDDLNLWWGRSHAAPAPISRKGCAYTGRRMGLASDP
jgi:hypothetical protein